MKSLIIIPTYNQAENLSPLLQAIFLYAPLVDVLIVDDHSPDGTGVYVLRTRLSKQSPSIPRAPSINHAKKRSERAEREVSEVISKSSGRCDSIRKYGLPTEANKLPVETLEFFPTAYL